MGCKLLSRQGAWGAEKEGGRWRGGTMQTEAPIYRHPVLLQGVFDPLTRVQSEAKRLTGPVARP